MPFPRTGIQRTSALITDVYPAKTAIVTPPAGHSIRLTEIVASNLDGGPRALTLREESANIAPQMLIAASGTLFWDEIGGPSLELIAGSGLTGSLNVAGTVDITVYYVLIDNSAGITKSSSRSASYTASTTTPKAIRLPNVNGSQ